MGICTDFRKTTLEVSSRFMFERPVSCVGRADLSLIAATDADRGTDRDIYDGTFVGSHGFARVAYHHDTKTLCLIATKAPTNVRGVRDRANNSILATHDGLSRSYIIAAYRLKDDSSNSTYVGRHLRRALEKFGIDLADRSEKHFRQFAGRYPIDTDAPATGRYGEIFTNGSTTYVLTPDKHGKYTARFNAAARRLDGHFMPFDPLDQAHFGHHITHIGKDIYHGSDYETARQAIEGHSVRVYSRLWDQKSLYQDEGAAFKARKWRASAANYIADHSVSAATTALLSAAVFAHNPTAGLGTAIGVTALHTLAHKLTDESLHGAINVVDKARAARAKTSVHDYPFDTDVSDHLKIQTPDNIAKLCPKIDLNRFPAHGFEFLTSRECGLLLDHETVENGMQPENLRGHLINAHLRGFRSTSMVVDNRTMIDDFRNGLVRLMHEKQNGNVVVYARYRPEFCTAEHMRLPQGYIEQFDGGMVRLEYDRRGPHFRQSITTQYGIKHRDMIDEIDDKLLFSEQRKAAAGLRAQSKQVIDGVFHGASKTGTPAYPLPDINAALA